MIQAASTLATHPKSRAISLATRKIDWPIIDPTTTAMADHRPRPRTSCDFLLASAGFIEDHGQAAQHHNHRRRKFSSYFMERDIILETRASKRGWPRSGSRYGSILTKLISKPVRSLASFSSQSSA